MKIYEKPIVLLNEELAEGIFATGGSGDIVTDGAGGRPDGRPRPKCESKYMDGWHGGNSAADNNKEFFGCRGCPAYTGHGCKLDDSGFDAEQHVGNLKPQWERNGETPMDSPNNRPR